jgi:hypothetical protein
METYKNFKQHLIDNPGLLLRALSEFSWSTKSIEPSSTED